jgi:hypothetical protein
LSLEVAAVVPGLAAVEVPEACFNQAATKLRLQQYESWWVKAVVVVGVPSAIALGLVWSDRAQLSDAVYYNKAVLSGMVVTDTAHDLRVTEKFNELSRQTQETNRILMAGCVNDAKTENERNRCLGR